MDTVHDVTEAVLGLEIHFGLPSGSVRAHPSDWHILLVAKQDIAPGTELTHNYSLSGDKTRCLCGCGRTF
jgi:hypothetical protein